MEAFLTSTGVVALGEVGDKTQLLALMLAARYRRAGPIVAGIFVATLANHALAAWLGQWLREVMPEGALRWGLGLAFLAVAAWALKPDRLDDPPMPLTGAGVFAMTTVAFFVAEMGDKRQVATVMLSARFDAMVAVVIGTTLGMLLANVPVVVAGRMASARIPFALVRMAAAATFAAIGLWVLVFGLPA
jgi:putative Ca2+/H+ antiporter (TMEM165/GDT1 family)